MSAPVLTPVTSEKSGRESAFVQPLTTPAPNAPSSPPAESASHGPRTVGIARRKPSTESA